MTQSQNCCLCLQSIIDACGYICLISLLALIASHLISRILDMLRKPVKLSKESQVVITGACMGLGKQMAIEIAKLYHCKILIIDIRQDLYPDLESKLKQNGSQSQFYLCDLSNQQSVQKLIQFLNKRSLKINLFIHNAGIHIPKKALQTSEKEFMMQQRVNFLSPVKIIKNTITLMENGHIALVASVVALAHGGIDVSAYSSSKHAIYSWVNSFRQQLKASKSSITISMGCPYMIRTGMFDGFKTRLDFLFRTLDPAYCGKRLVRQFIQKKEICYIYEIVSLFPTFILDTFSIYCNISNFDKIKDRHAQSLRKTQ